MSTLAGRAIEGEIKTGDALKEQHPESEFTDALDKVLSIDGVEAVRWRQYTPYFNDGDPCVFGANDAYVKLADADEEAGDYGDGFLDYYGLEAGELHDAIKALSKVINSGHHNVLLSQKFGDHAIVTATKEKFVVDYYNHD